MIQADNHKERHTLPRWNSLEIAKQLGELDSGLIATTPSASPLKLDLDDLLAEWNLEKNLPLAMEIISASRILNCCDQIPEIIEYAANATNALGETPSLIREFLFDEKNTNISLADTHQVCVEKIKKTLVGYPRNPLLWSELSREYTILGQKKKSEKAIQIALSLAPNDRTVLRAVARFYSHVGDIEQGLFYLRKCPRLKDDPWLLSSEIALSNTIGKTSRNIKRAQQIISDENYHPLALSELASELGTMDFIAGSSKQGKQKLALATRQPHENAVAQIMWINKNAHNVQSLLEKTPPPDYNFEAEARWSFDKCAWREALTVAGKWQEYQPFSAEPAMLCSFIATDFLMDFTNAETALYCSLKSNPNNYHLLNNYAYVLALDSKLTDATHALERAKKITSFDNHPPLIATSGLLCYRSGDIIQGRLQYRRAIDAARKENKQDLFYRATLCMAREEKRIGFPVTEIMQTIADSKYDFLKKQYQTVISNFGLDAP